MGLFDFVKDAGEKIFGHAADDKAARADVQAKAEKGKEMLDDRRKAGGIVRFVEGLGLAVSDLSVRVDGDTATVKGSVPSLEAREKVVLAVGNTQGIAHVDDQLEVSAPGGGSSGSADSTLYTVQRGDTLSGIAKRHYGDAGAYGRIFEANKPMLKDPDKIYPGQVLRIPPKS